MIFQVHLEEEKEKKIINTLDFCVYGFKSQ